MTEISTFHAADKIDQRTHTKFMHSKPAISLFASRDRQIKHNLPKRARPSLDDFYPDHCADTARADKAFKQALLLAGIGVRADYHGASYLRYFQPHQEIDVKTIFVRFFDPPDEETEEAAWAECSRFSEAQSFYDDLPDYTECADDENLSGYHVQGRPELVGRNGCTVSVPSVRSWPGHLRNISTFGLPAELALLFLLA